MAGIRPGKGWRKSTHSGDTSIGTCVETAGFEDGTVGLRDSQDPEGGHIAVEVADFARMLAAVKHL